MKVKDKNIGSDEEGTFMNENIILILFLVWFLGVGSVGTNWQSTHSNKSSLRQGWGSVPCSAKSPRQFIA